MSSIINNLPNPHLKPSYMRVVFIISGVILLTMFFYVHLMNTWQQTLAKSVNENIIKNVMIKPETKENEQKLKNKQTLQTIAFSQISLPDLPNTLLVKPKKVIDQTASKKIKISKGIKKYNKVQDTVIKKIPEQTNQPLRAIGEQTAQIYHQLISDQSLSIEIAWPAQSYHREKLFKYLYQCADVRFGVLNQQGVTLAKQTRQQNTNDYRSKIKTQHSEWLRIAQGSLGKNEKEWLNQYQLSGTPIRLFPKYIDWQLANLIAEYLAGKVDSQGKPLALNHLRAEYQLKGQRLILDNISINNQELNGSWLLVEKKCVI